jgi:hypothetical protein
MSATPAALRENPGMTVDWHKLALFATARSLS